MIPLNIQNPLPKSSDVDGELAVVNSWETIQGEGPFAGRRSVFVRLAGCNLKCPMCDTDYTSHAVWHSPESLHALIQTKFDHHRQFIDTLRFNPLIVITGGEPFRQNFGPFARLAMQDGWHIQVETNGTLFQEDVPIIPMTVVCSPKTPKINDDLKRHIKHLKYVIRCGEVDPHDGLPTSVLGYNFSPARPWNWFDGEIWIQPADEQDEKANQANLETAKQITMKHGYRLGIQIHKQIGVE